MSQGGQTAGRCLFCGAALEHTFLDLGMSPLCESFIPPEKANEMEAFYPLHVFVCSKCFLVQLPVYVNPSEIFSEYAYFSSYSKAWLEHAKSYTAMISDRLSLNAHSQVVELASNDGYLLQYFAERGIPVLGVEPAANVAEAATAKGIPTLVKFFNEETAHELVADGKRADLICGNNVLAQVPDINSFVEGMKILLGSEGVITIEFPHLMRLMAENQFDTIYHEHFFYFSLVAAERIFAAHRLTLFDVEELWTHGGSLRIYARHSENQALAPTARLLELREREIAAGFLRLEGYAGFGERVRESKRRLLDFLIRTKREGKSIAGYGAPGKGNTLLNYCGIRTDFLDYTVDRNPHKHGRLLPGTRIPIFPPERIEETRPDFVMILPWNLKEEIMAQLSHIRDWGGQFVVPIPEVTVYP